MPKRIFAAFLILLAIASLACSIVTLRPSAAKTGIQGVSVDPAKGSGTFTIKINYTHRLGDPVQPVVCTAAGDEHTLQPSDDPGDQVMVLPIWMVEPGNYTATCSSKADDAYSAVFEVIVPNETPQEKPSTGAQPVKIETTGVKFIYPDISTCTSDQLVTLTVNADGTATLTAAGPGIKNMETCEKDVVNEVYYMDGTADPATETVTFSTCNNGGFKAVGQVSYAGRKVTGEVTCAFTDGQVRIRLKVP